MFVNLTPHDINILNQFGDLEQTIPSSGRTARLRNRDGKQKIVEGVRLIKANFGQPENLPEPQPGVYLIVSNMVRLAPACITRTDLISPRDLVRDHRGIVVGCQAFDWN